MCLSRLGFYERALECCDQALLTNVLYSNAYFHKGVIYEGTKRYDEALACYQKANRLKPDNQKAVDRANIVKAKI